MHQWLERHEESLAWAGIALVLLAALAVVLAGVMP